ncbi:MAG: hypothetical protein GWN00_05250 [Aliifodinibius sp.]|nr:hypothetical protein [Fodinibius sp.]NIV10608.1 hypothetical protein [Fodinibius sp.]NIY24236.1 hypothetical protein [Fodinibius sp.]
MITKCPHCNTKFKARDDLENKKTKCPKCEQPFTISKFIPHSTPQVNNVSTGEKSVDTCASCGKPKREGIVYKGNVCFECYKKSSNRVEVYRKPLMIQYRCEKCSTKVESSIELAGKKDTCPTCRHENKVPEGITLGKAFLGFCGGIGLCLIIVVVPPNSPITCVTGIATFCIGACVSLMSILAFISSKPSEKMRQN